MHGAGVRFVLIGGMAAILHGDIAVTLNLDGVPKREASILERNGLRQHFAPSVPAFVPRALRQDCPSTAPARSSGASRRIRS